MDDCDRFKEPPFRDRDARTARRGPRRHCSKLTKIAKPARLHRRLSSKAPGRTCRRAKPSRANTTISSSARAPPAACSPIGCPPIARNKVLLLEAGGRDNWIWFHIPVGYLFAIGNPRSDWMYRTEAGAGAERAEPCLSARQGARRLVRDQRHDLHARAGRRLRSLAPARPGRLGLGRRAAYLPQTGQPFSRRQRASFEFGRMAGGASARALGHHRRVPRSGGAIRNPELRRLQHWRQRGLRLFPRQPEARPPLVLGARISRAGAGRPNLRVETGCLAEDIAFDAKRATGIRFRQNGAAEIRALPRRSDPVGGRDRLGAAPAAFRHRSGAAAWRAWHRDFARASRASARICRIICNCG